MGRKRKENHEYECIIHRCIHMGHEERKYFYVTQEQYKQLLEEARRYAMEQTAVRRDAGDNEGDSR